MPPAQGAIGSHIQLPNQINQFNQPSYYQGMHPSQMQ